MELREYWRVFKRRAWIPILLVIVTAVTAGALTLVSKPEYTATAHGTAKSSGLTANGQTASFPEVCVRVDVVDKVIKDLNLSDPPDALQNRIKITSGKSDVYNVTITDPNPDQAVRIANAVAAAAAIHYQEVNGGIGTTSVFDQEVQKALADYEKRYLDAQEALLTFSRTHPGAAQSKDLSIVRQGNKLQLEADQALDAYKNFANSTAGEDARQAAQAILSQAGVTDQAIAKPDTTSRFFKIGYAAALALILGVG